ISVTKRAATGSVPLARPESCLLSRRSAGKAASLGLAVKLRARREIDFRCRVEPDHVPGLTERGCLGFVAERLWIGGMRRGDQRERYAGGEKAKATAFCKTGNVVWF